MTAPKAIAQRVGLSAAVVLIAAMGAPAFGADDPLAVAMKLYDKRRYEQAARALEQGLPRVDSARLAQAHLVLGTIYLRDAGLHEALARVAAATEFDYLDKLVKSGTEGRSRYARLYLAEARLARGSAADAARHFEKLGVDFRDDAHHQAIADIGFGSALWANKDNERARGLWAAAGSDLETRLARAAAEGRAGVADAKSLQEVAHEAARAREISPRARRYLIEIYLAAGAPERSLALVRSADLSAASYVEKFQAAKGTAKNIYFYDLALLTDLAQLYRELARRNLEQAAADPGMRPTAEFYLAELFTTLGRNEEAQKYAQAFLAQPQLPPQYRDRARARQNVLMYRQGKRAEAENSWAAMAEQGDPEALAEIAFTCTEAGAPCAKAVARLGQSVEAGDSRRVRRLNAALGSYYLRAKDYARAITYMEAGRDKTNKNKIEANDPEALIDLAEAYYRTKKFSEGLEILFEMSKEFPVVRQIQEAMQGVYSMEQRSAGDVKIF